MDRKTVENKKRRSPKKPGFVVNAVCLSVVAILFFGVAVLNLFQFSRPVYSESEKRDLARFPEFSFSALFDGSYFKGISDFISDTFWQRDALVSASRKMEELKGFQYRVNGEPYVVIDVDDPVESRPETTDYDPNQFSHITLPPEITTREEETTSGDTGTLPPDITTEEGQGTSGDPPVTTSPPVTTPEPFVLRSISLSASSVELKPGGSGLLSVTLTSTGAGAPPPVEWTTSNASVVQVTPTNNGASLYATGKGSATVTAKCGSLVAACAVTVKEQEHVGPTTDDVQEIQGGVFRYQDRLYQPVNYGDSLLVSLGKEYSKMAEYYRRLFGCRVSMVAAPHAVMLLDVNQIPKAGRDQGEMLNVMATAYDSTINFVNIYNEMYAHRDEYLYFKSDHHWTGLGAYYGYSAFMKSLGETPYPLDSFNYKLVRESVVGTYGAILPAYALNGITDKFEIWAPTKELTMTVTYVPSDGIPPSTYSSAILDRVFPGSYMAFLSGDRPMVVINVPENPQDKKILVLHDSYGNAMIPYLAQHYGTIVAVDPRYYFSSFSQNLQDQFKDYGFTDVLFLMNIMMANSDVWLKMYYNVIGVR